jgi:glycosyltransferase involved in cell wall biosynthesis
VRVGIDASCWANQRGYGRYTRELVRVLLETDQQNSYTLFLDAATERLSHDLPSLAERVIVSTSSAASEAASAQGHRSIGDLFRMSRAVSSRGRDLDLFYFPSVYTFFPVPRRLKPLVTIHDTIAERHPGLIFPHWYNRVFWNIKVACAIRQSSLVLTVSESARAAIAAAHKLPADRIRVVSDAVNPLFAPSKDTPDRRQLLSARGIDPGQRFLLYVGGISPHKSIDTLLEAHAQLAAETPYADVRLVLVGDYKRDVFFSSYDALRRRSSPLVLFTGFVPDDELRHWYSAASTVVLPSVDEGFGLPIIEAMACGTPVVASRAGALPEIVADAGLLFEPRNVDALLAALKSVLSDDAIRQRLSAEGLKRAAQFTWQASARAAIEAFEEVDARRSGL